MQTVIELCDRIYKILNTQTDALVTQNFDLLSSCTLELLQIEKSLRESSSSFELTDEGIKQLTELYQFIKNKKALNDSLMTHSQQYMNFLHDEVRYL